MIDALIREMKGLEDAESSIARKRREAARKALLELRDRLGGILAITGLSVRVDHSMRLTGTGWEFLHSSDRWHQYYDRTPDHPASSVAPAISYSKILKSYLEKDLPNISRSLKLRGLEDEYLEVRRLLAAIKTVPED